MGHTLPRGLTAPTSSFKSKNGHQRRAYSTGANEKDTTQTTDQQATPPNTGEENSYVSEVDRKKIAAWLFICAGMVFVMVVVGGVTRLTESGLSITEWKPVTGAMFPMNEADWLVEFEKYRQTPEYKKLNANMTVDEFKNIYFWEWAHRMLGRLIGVAFAGPMVYFAARKSLSGKLAAQLAVLFGLGGAQGALGWYMVKSGLEVKDHEVPRVSQYRLAAHLSSAFIIYMGLIWTGMNVLHSTPRLPSTSAVKSAVTGVASKALQRSALGLTALTLITAFSGAFVAGLDAGMQYNEFPWMGWDPTPGVERRRIVPPEYWSMDPAWLNWFENSAAVQFNHRVLGVSTFLASNALWLWSRRVPTLPRVARVAATSVAHMAWLQVALGISTLIYVVPVPLAATHQAGSLTLLTLSTWFLHIVLRRRLPF
jgi:cytochrome c oxidase assembly protein subunit 15